MLCLFSMLNALDSFSLHLSLEIYIFFCCDYNYLRAIHLTCFSYNQYDIVLILITRF